MGRCDDKLVGAYEISSGAKNLGLRLVDVAERLGLERVTESDSSLRRTSVFCARGNALRADGLQLTATLAASSVLKSIKHPCTC